MSSIGSEFQAEDDQHRDDRHSYEHSQNLVREGGGKCEYIMLDENDYFHFYI